MFSFMSFTCQWFKRLSFKVHNMFFSSSTVYRWFLHLHSPKMCLHSSNTKVKLCLKDPGRKESALKAEQNSNSDIGCLGSGVLSLLNFVYYCQLFLWLKVHFYAGLFIFYVHHISLPHLSFLVHLTSLILFTHCHLYLHIIYNWWFYGST